MRILKMWCASAERILMKIDKTAVGFNNTKRRGLPSHRNLSMFCSNNYSDRIVKSEILNPEQIRNANVEAKRVGLPRSHLLSCFEFQYLNSAL